MFDENTTDCHTVYRGLGRMAQVSLQKGFLLVPLLSLLALDSSEHDRQSPRVTPRHA